MGSSFRLNRAAIKAIVSPPKARRVIVEIAIDVPETKTDEHAKKMVLDALIVECWEGEVLDPVVTRVCDPTYIDDSEGVDTRTPEQAAADRQSGIQARMGIGRRA